jgi:hypothetical protein
MLIWKITVEFPPSIVLKEQQHILTIIYKQFNEENFDTSQSFPNIWIYPTYKTFSSHNYVWILSCNKVMCSFIKSVCSLHLFITQHWMQLEQIQMEIVTVFIRKEATFNNHGTLLLNLARLLWNGIITIILCCVCALHLSHPCQTCFPWHSCNVSDLHWIFAWGLSWFTSTPLTRRNDSEWLQAIIT